MTRADIERLVKALTPEEVEKLRHGPWVNGVWQLRFIEVLAKASERISCVNDQP